MGSDLRRRPTSNELSAAFREAGQRVQNASSVLVVGVLLAVTFQLAYQLLRTVIAIPRGRPISWPWERRPPAVVAPPVLSPPPADTRPIHTGPFAAFHYRGFVVNYIGSIFGVNGYFIYWTAQGWIALQLTNSAAGISLLFTITSLPMLALTLFGGALADRFDRPRVVMVTRVFVTALMTVMGLATISGAMTVEVFVGTSLVLGVLWAIDLPARQAVIADTVPPAVMANGYSWQSVIQFVGSTVGPIIAGFIVVSFGAGIALIISGIGHGMVGLSMLFIGPRAKRVISTESVARRVWGGLTFIGRHESILLLILLAAIPSITAFGIQPLLPLVARDTLSGDAGTYGLLVTAMGVGSIVGALFVAFTQHIKVKGWLAAGAGIVGGLGIIAFAYTQSLAPAFTFLLVYGAANGAGQTLTSALVQSLTPQEYQGRVASIYMMTWNVTPIGILVFGAFAQAYGVAFGIWLAGIAMIGLTLALFALRPKLRQLRA